MSYIFPCISVALILSAQSVDVKYGQVSEDDPSLVQIPNGLVQGDIVDNQVVMFRSIPYGESPTNQLRWADPLAKEPWGVNETLYATHDPPGCPQRCALPPQACPTHQSEDCLFLNIYKPLNVTSNKPLPTMIFIHGGNFFQGYSGGILYNGTNMVEQTDVIIVTINYRLGALGFLWSLTGPHGNYGMKDQLLAFEWVKNNIQYFGGDATRVVIYGQSAGAISVAMHMTYNYPNNLNLFQAAIMESEPFGLPIRDLKTWGTLPNNFYHNLGCDDDRFGHDERAFWECLRNKTVSEVVNAQTITQDNLFNEFDHFWDLFLPWTPTAGTDMYSEQVFWSFQNGEYVDIPYVIGTVANEGVLFVYETFPDGMTELEIVALMELLVGDDDSRAILKQYPLPSRQNTTDYRPYASLLIGDGLMRCPSWNVTMQHSVHKNTNKFENNAWVYHFNHVSSFNAKFWGQNFSYCDSVVCHGAELEYVFNANGAPVNITPNEDEFILAQTMQIFWGNLATDHDPGTSFNLKWKEFELKNQFELIFDAPGTRLTANYDNVTCQFWNMLNYNWIK
eukprot:10481_1